MRRHIEAPATDFSASWQLRFWATFWGAPSARAVAIWMSIECALFTAYAVTNWSWIAYAGFALMPCSLMAAFRAMTQAELKR